MSRIAMAEGVVSRRRMLAAAGGGLVYSAIPSSVESLNAREQGSSLFMEHFAPLRNPMVRVVAVQGSPAEMSSRQSEGSRCETLLGELHHVRRQINGIDLVAFSGNQLYGLSADRRTELIGQMSAEAGSTYVAFTSHVARAAEMHGAVQPAYLISPNGGVLPISGEGHSVINTEIGVLGFSTGHSLSGSIEALADKGAEIIVHNLTAGCRPFDVQECSRSKGVFSIMVTDSKDDAMEAHTATAIFGSAGEILSRTGASWQQTITAGLPIQKLRTQRQA